MSHTPGQGGDKLEVNLTPLLDLVLQLIMFFMLTVNFVRVDQLNEEVSLPVAQAAMPVKDAGTNWVYLNMTREGKVVVGSGERLNTPTQLRSYIRTRKEEIERVARLRGQKDVNIVIVLRAHRDATYGDVWNTLDECNRAGYARWQLRVLKQA